MIIRKMLSAVSCYFPHRSTCVRDPLKRDRSVKIAQIERSYVYRDDQYVGASMRLPVGSSTRSCHIVKMIMNITTSAFGRIRVLSGRC